jgi:hypothetical protein
MIVLTLYTYNPGGPLGDARQRYAEATLAAAFKHLKSSEPIWCHIADDGSAPEYRSHLWDLAGAYAGDLRSISNSERRGYGGNYNQASWFTHQLADVSALLHLEDDWVLTRDLDLDPLVTVLKNEPRIGMIRMGWIGYTHPLRAEFVWTQGQHYLLLDPQSPSQYVFSGGPRLETVDWARSVGPWPEGLPAGETELAVCGRPAARQGVAWPIEIVGPQGHLWEHIGTEQVKNAPTRQAVTA